MNDVAIVLVAGKKENELIITINSRGIVEYNWIKPNYAKETYVHVSLKKIFLMFICIILTHVKIITESNAIHYKLYLNNSR